MPTLNIGDKLFLRKKNKITRERVSLVTLIKNALVYSKPLSLVDDNATFRHHLQVSSDQVLKEMTSEKSVSRIVPFVKNYKIDMDLFKPKEYVSYNDFFIREIKPEMRPVSSQFNDKIVVSTGDSRVSVFKNIKQAQDLLIKGKKFNLERLVDGDMRLVDEFKDACFVNFRLAPQDYHHYHSPIMGKVTYLKGVAGTHWTSEPIALRSTIDVIGENEREILVIENSSGLKCLHIAIGASDIGRVHTIVETEEFVLKGQELGYFSYGGSDILVAFNRKIDFDSDLVYYTNRGIETLLECNQQIGVVRDLELV